MSFEIATVLLETSEFWKDRRIKIELETSKRSCWHNFK